MPRSKVEFTNNQNHKLAGLLELPSQGKPRAMALFAEEYYQAAKRPKSFISLDNADHLLSSAVDAEYVADMLVAWSSRYL